MDQEALFQVFKENVQKFSLLRLEDFYTLIDKIVYINSLPPARTANYYSRWSNWIARLESEGVIEQKQYVQQWSIIKKEKEVRI